MQIRIIATVSPKKASNQTISVVDVTMRLCDGIQRFVKNLIEDVGACAGIKHTCPIPKVS